MDESMHTPKRPRRSTRRAAEIVARQGDLFAGLPEPTDPEVHAARQALWNKQAVARLQRAAFAAHSAHQRPVHVGDLLPTARELWAEAQEQGLRFTKSLLGRAFPKRAGWVHTGYATLVAKGKQRTVKAYRQRTALPEELQRSLARAAP